MYTIRIECELKTYVKVGKRVYKERKHDISRYIYMDIDMIILHYCTTGI